jgi:soluble lytic murein transglycosylase-like protein
MTPRAIAVAAICGGFVLAGGAAELVMVPRPVQAQLKAAPRPRLTQPELEALLGNVAKSLDPELRNKLAEAVIAESVRAGYDPLFVLGLVSVESGFRVQASSERGASGLMQLKPSTFAWISGREPDIGSDGYAAAEDPVIDVRLGIRYIRWLESRFHSRNEALMAYNAGPRRLQDYKKTGEIPENVRDYPRRVLREYRRFVRLTGRSDPDVTVASAR